MKLVNIDPYQSNKYQSTLTFSDKHGFTYIYNLAMKNCKTTLNYFALAIMIEDFTIAALLADHIYASSQKYNTNRFKSRDNDKLYQRCINPTIVIENNEFYLLNYLIKTN